jgi:hypothetical protein
MYEAVCQAVQARGAPLILAAVSTADIFDTNAADWSYKAIVPGVLRSTKLLLPPDAQAKAAYPRHAAAY